MKFVPVAGVLLLAALSGCATLKPTAPPAVVLGQTPVFVAHEFPSKAQKSAAHSVPDSYFGVSSHKSGSAGVGVLFGVLGVLANVAYVEAQGQKAAVAGKSLFTENLGDWLIEADVTLDREPMSPPATGYFELVPAASIYYERADTFHTNCYLHSVYVVRGKKAWQARYGINNSERYSKGMAVDAEAVRADLKQCLGKALDLFARHRAQGTAMFRSAEVQFANGKSVLPVAHELLPARLVYFDGAGLFELGRPQWKTAVLK